MVVIENSRYAEAWRDRRRRMVLFKTIQFLFLPMILAAAVISSKLPGTYRKSMPQAFIALPIWFVAYVAAGVWLNRFRCPRCGKFYYWRLEWKGSVERQKNWRNCHHCNLQQDARPG
jgi:hypothetical protein